MKYLSAAALLWLAGSVSEVDAQSAARAGQKIVIAHRLAQWESKHFDDAGTAQQHADAVKKLGAEVRVDRHEGHTDVVYRSPRWTALRVESDELAHQWEDWLKAAGFETLHGHSPEHEEHAHHDEHGHGDEHEEVVLFRAPAWGEQHFDSKDASDQFAILAEALRCEVERSRHAGHFDVRYRCPKWTAVEFGDHKTAEAWEEWLASAGFEVKHDEHE